MMFLELVNRARRECGVSGVALSTLQHGLTAEGQRFVDWTTDAWNDLQIEKPDWQWMRKTFTFQTVPSQANYTPAQAGAADAASWKIDSFRAFATVAGYGDEQIVPPMSWDVWRNVYQFGANRTATGRPVAIAVGPDKSLNVGPLPDDAYTVIGEYYRKPTTLVNDTDSPSDAGNDLPDRYHMLLVYEVMERYALYESAPEVRARAETGRKRPRNALMAQYLPQIGFGPPLA